ncbi:hypothetical protein FAUST_1442 [Fusarium austroamericanum]|uniref:Uncharacterized protein n=1 Tax=Fusarium austroamericanum TaxID=282268 RepID=A0AAN6C8P4_FUSAU|nr:hypothetical protein FAUST_1442 [Fusarium austroamericanum]
MPDSYTIKTEEEWVDGMSKTDKETNKVIMKRLEDWEFNSKTKKITGSKLDRAFLFAYHVIVEQQDLPLLPVLKGAIAADTNPPHDYDGQVQKFIDGDGKGTAREHKLFQNNGGSLGMIWSSLQRVQELRKPPPETAPPTSPRPRRAGNKRKRYPVLSDAEREDSQASEKENDRSYVKAVATTNLPSEDYTVRMISSVLRHVIYHSQSENELDTLEFREKESLEFKNRRGVAFHATDDGGLSLRDRTNMISNFIAIVEAKKAMYTDEKGDHYIYHKDLAQMTCEAIVAKQCCPGQLCGDSVVIIHAVRNFICFLEFKISKGYMDQFINGETPAEPLVVHTTKWFDISKGNGRSGIADNLRGLIKASQ